MSMPVSVGCQHLDVEACVGLSVCVRWVVVMMEGVTVADTVVKRNPPPANFSATIIPQ